MGESNTGLALRPQVKQVVLRRISPRSSSELNADRLLNELQVHQVELEMQNKELRMTRDELESALTQYAELYDFSPVSYFTLAGDGKILQTNLSGASMLGIERSLLIGNDFRLFVSNQSKKPWIDFFARLFATQTKMKREITLETKYGHINIMAIGVCAKGLGREDKSQCQLALIDITARKLADKALIQGKNEAMAANRAKSEFLANMSHEIRNPINAVLGLTKLALRRDLGEEVREFLEGVQEAGSSLMQIINDILDFSKIEAGHIILENEFFELRPLLDKIIKSFVPTVLKKKLNLDIRVNEDIPDLLEGDQGRLRQVLINLIGNAIKFTQVGEVTVSVSLEHFKMRPANAQEDQCRLLFAVSDTGIGIPRDKTTVIFDSFTQADSTTTKRFGGTGLGLAISKKLTGLMSGKIWVESVPDKGSTFYFTAAFGHPKEEESVAVNGHAQLPPPPRSLRILLAEDDRMNQIFAEAFLSDAGHKVSIAGNGKQVLKMLEGASYDLILMDISMPEMDGDEATRIIRSSTSGAFDPQIPIVAMTAHALKGDHERFMSSGMNGYITKPVDMDELFQAITLAMALPTIGIPHTREAERSPGEGAITALPVLDKQWNEKHFGKKKLVLRNLMEIYQSELPKRINEVRQAMEAQSFTDIARAAHTLKGASGVIGASEVREKAFRVELASRDENMEKVVEAYRLLDTAAQSVTEALIEELGQD